MCVNATTNIQLCVAFEHHFYIPLKLLLLVQLRTSQRVDIWCELFSVTVLSNTLVALMRTTIYSPSMEMG